MERCEGSYKYQGETISVRSATMPSKKCDILDAGFEGREDRLFYYVTLSEQYKDYQNNKADPGTGNNAPGMMHVIRSMHLWFSVIK